MKVDYQMSGPGCQSAVFDADGGVLYGKRLWPGDVLLPGCAIHLGINVVVARKRLWQSAELTHPVVR
jgi:hypothetical protein